jgi:protein tyrosine phosphatase (PTP) superfamily phosphohydrolase (DUF442 family)
LVSTPVPPARAAQDVSKTNGRPANEGDGDSVLDHLPPLDLPAEVTEKNSTPPVAPAAERKPQGSTSASDRNGGRSPRESDLSLAGTSRPAPVPASALASSALAPVAAPTGEAPGIARFMAVDLKLAGGSVPSTAGLDWLADKGYKTLIDLREAPETNLGFIAEAAKRGLRYIALPVGLAGIDRDHMARFNFELSLGEARPLYFYDSDGNRAGALWYLRRITVDRVDTQVARREAEKLGLSDPQYWLAASHCLERLDAARAPSSKAPGPVQSAPPANPVSRPQEPPRTASPAGPSAPPAPGLPERETPAEAKATVPPAGTAPVPTAEVPAPVADASSFQIAQTDIPSTTSAPSPPADPTAWRTLAAMTITGLTFPLAYWTRAVVPTILAKTRASLPGPAPRWKSLPRASDAGT